MPTAFFFINTEPVSMPEVLKKIKAVEAVEEAEMVYGGHYGNSVSFLSGAPWNVEKYQ